MLPELHETLTTLLYDYGRLPRDEIDISFEMPTREWVDSLVRPTISFFLFDVEENTELRHTSMQTSRSFSERSGREVGVHRMPPRRFDLRYMVSAPNSEVEHEHLLLYRTLVTLLRHQEFPIDVLERVVRETLDHLGFKENDIIQIKQDLSLTKLRQFVEALPIGVGKPGKISEGGKEALRTLTLEPPISTRVVKSGDGTRLSELWGALDLPPRPTLFYTVTIPVDLSIQYEEPLVLRRMIRYTDLSPRNDRRGVDRVMDLERTIIGGIVQNREGLPVQGIRVEVVGGKTPGVRTDERGRFELAVEQLGKLRFRLFQEDQLVKDETRTVADTKYEPLYIELD